MEVIFQDQPPSVDVIPQAPPGSSERAGEQPAPTASTERVGLDPAQAQTNEVEDRADQVMENPVEESQPQPQGEEAVDEEPAQALIDDVDPVRHTARLQGKPPPMSNEMLADITKSHLLLMQMMSDPSQGI